MAGEHPGQELLVHLCPSADWATVRTAAELRPESLAETGFVHLSTPAQIHLPANRLFAGRADILVLFVDPTGLGAPLRWEPGVPGDPVSMLFPHLYGAVPMTAVREVRPYLPGPNGRFEPLIPRPVRDR
jgi:uncharacterized protein (DUF952 family)